MARLQPQYTNYNPNTDRTAQNFTEKADPLGQFRSGRVGGLVKTAAKMALAYFTGGAGGALGGSAAAGMGAGAAGQALGSSLGAAAGRSLGSGDGLKGMAGGLLGIGLEGVGGALGGESLGDIGGNMMDSYVAQNAIDPTAGPWDGANQLKDMVTNPSGNWENIANVASGGKYGQVRGLINNVSDGDWMGAANNITGGKVGAGMGIADAVSDGAASEALDNYMNRAGSASLNAASSMGGPTMGHGVGIMDAKTLDGMGGSIGATSGANISAGDVGPVMNAPIDGMGGETRIHGQGLLGPGGDTLAGFADSLGGGVGKGLLSQSVYDDSAWSPINPNETSGVQNTFGQRRKPPQQQQTSGWNNSYAPRY